MSSFYWLNTRISKQVSVCVVKRSISTKNNHIFSCILCLSESKETQWFRNSESMHFPIITEGKVQIKTSLSLVVCKEKPLNWKRSGKKLWKKSSWTLNVSSLGVTCLSIFLLFELFKTNIWLLNFHNECR